MLRKFLPFDRAINFRDCISNSMPNVFRFADQISDIIGNVQDVMFQSFSTDLTPSSKVFGRFKKGNLQRNLVIQQVLTGFVPKCHPAHILTISI